MDQLAGIVMAADLVLRGGHVWAGKGLPPATALAARDGRVVAVGSDAEVAPWIGAGTRVVELGGRLAVPGFVERDIEADPELHRRFLERIPVAELGTRRVGLVVTVGMMRRLLGEVIDGDPASLPEATTR